MNERLSFSWGHIVAFLALIAISYLSFVGFVYLFNEATINERLNHPSSHAIFGLAALGMGIIDFLFILIFIGAQQMKASGTHIARKIIFERFFIYISPLVFVAGMIPVSHFWTIYEKNDAIVNEFNASLDCAHQLFTEYEQYADERIKKYNQIVNGSESMMTTLQLQLRSKKNYNEQLKGKATEWLNNDKTKNVSIFNAYILGNAEAIKKAIEFWSNHLQNISSKRFTLENSVEDFHSKKVLEATNHLNKMKTYFTTLQVPTPKAYVTGLALYLMLIFPYLLQERHSKSIWGRSGKKANKSQNDGGNYPIF